MAKKKRKAKSYPIKKVYQISLPLFVIPLKKEDNGLFGALDEKQMVDNLKIVLDKFPVTQLASRGKSKTTHITSLESTVVDIGDKKALLVRASVFDSDLDDTYINDGSNKTKVGESSRIGGEKYFILFYPRIEGQDSDKYIYTWLQIVYEDPTHPTGVATSVAKKIVQSQIQTEPFNVKLQSAIDDFKAISVCPEVQVRLVSTHHESDNKFPSYQSHLMDVKVREERTYTYSNMPQDKVESLLKDNSDDGEVVIQKKAIFGKKEYHVKRERFDEHSAWRESVEQLFNSKHEVTREEVKSGKISDPKYVVEVFTSVLSNYLSNK